ncbi:DNA-3-methyladenine glycosylase I [Lactiplantibacillus herbarum]|uniref:DNA-3-methyladenine glycosylase I n=1 Tax=Lactiplantibacillus herbarum TaxID=1670446 RepID=UPI00064F31F3|nr:DNA-3-methyladenine glycosylase I [Lactiplantibacillus herbarum]
MTTTWFDDDPLFNRYYPQNPSYRQYFDNEWGIPSHNDQQLFELLALSGFAAGLNWEMILNKRIAFSRAFANWDINTVANFDIGNITQILTDASIIRNQRKIMAAIHNAKIIQQLQATQSFDAYLWHHLQYQQVVLNVHHFHDLPRTVAASDQLSQQMRHDGFKFAGPITIHAWLVATGFITARPDHRGIELSH